MPLSGLPERAVAVSLLWSREERESIAFTPAKVEAPALTDELLMAQLNAGDKDALAEIFRRYSRLVFSLGLRILRDVGEAEEIVQDVFLYLFQKANLFDADKGTAKAWIVQVAHHRSLDRTRFLVRRQFYVGTDLTVLADTLAGSNDLERDVASNLNRIRLQEAFKVLSDKQRQTLEMFFFGGLELKEIAEQLGESLENVRHYYYRGLQKLRKNSFVQDLRDKRSE